MVVEVGGQGSEVGHISGSLLGVGSFRGVLRVSFRGSVTIGVSFRGRSYKGGSFRGSVVLWGRSY